MNTQKNQDLYMKQLQVTNKKIQDGISQYAEKGMSQEKSIQERREIFNKSRQERSEDNGIRSASNVIRLKKYNSQQKLHITNYGFKFDKYSLARGNFTSRNASTADNYSIKYNQKDSKQQSQENVKKLKEQQNEQNSVNQKKDKKLMEEEFNKKQQLKLKLETELIKMKEMMRINEKKQMEQEALNKKEKIKQMESQLLKNKNQNHKLYDTQFNFQDILKGVTSKTKVSKKTKEQKEKEQQNSLSEMKSNTKETAKIVQQRRQLGIQREKLEEHMRQLEDVKEDLKLLEDQLGKGVEGDKKVKVGQYINQQKELMKQKVQEDEEEQLSPFKLPKPSLQKEGSPEYQIVNHALRSQVKKEQQIEKFQLLNEEFIRENQGHKYFNEERIPNIYSLILNSLNNNSKEEGGGSGSGKKLKKNIEVYVQVIDKTVHNRRHFSLGKITDNK